MVHRALPSQPEVLRPSRFPRGTMARAIWALLMREMAAGNSRAVGGVFWIFLQPLFATLFLTMIFSAGFRSPPVGDVFAIFYATGVVPFMFYMSISGQLGNAVQMNRKLLAYPRITVLDTLLARLIFVCLVQAAVGVLLIGMILMIWETKTILILTPILEAVGLAVVLGFGVGCLNAYLFSVFPTYRHIWSILTQPLFLVSCVIFPYDSIPAPFDAWLWWNPLVHIVALSRTGFYPGYPAHHVEPLYPLGVGLACAVLGLILLNQGRAALLAR